MFIVLHASAVGSKMNFESDLVEIIKHQFSMENTHYKDDGDTGYFAARYCEMRIRRIVPVPRMVHFSDEINDSLGKLFKETNTEEKNKALEAWWAVFLIRDLLVKGKSVTQFLSKSVTQSLNEKTDGLLLDFGMHHFHLSRELEESGFVKRSDYLLFAIITDADAYFVDVRTHRDPERLEWVRQDLLSILHSNWPELIEPYVLQGQMGDVLTDEQKKELRRKKINHVTQLGDSAISPIGGGMMGDGSSTWCRVWGDRLLHEINQHQSYFDSQPVALRSQLQAKGKRIAGEMEFQLVLLDSLNLSSEQIDSLKKDQFLSQMGFAIVETTTRLPIVVLLKDQP